MTDTGSAGATPEHSGTTAESVADANADEPILSALDGDGTHLFQDALADAEEAEQ